MSMQEIDRNSLTRKEQRVEQLFYEIIGTSPKGIYVQPKVPSGKLDIAVRLFAPVSRGEAILALIDDPVFSSTPLPMQVAFKTFGVSSDAGVVMTSRGIYWKSISGKAYKKTYDQLADVATVTTPEMISNGSKLRDVESRIWLGTMAPKTRDSIDHFIKEAADACAKWDGESEDESNAPSTLDDEVSRSGGSASPQRRSESPNSPRRSRVLTTEQIDKQVIELFQEHVATREFAVYLYPDIPTKKLENAIQTYAKITSDEQILCLIDNTVFGSAKDGALLTSRAIYWKNPFEKPSCRMYRDLGGIEIVAGKKHHLLLKAKGYEVTKDPTVLSKTKIAVEPEEINLLVTQDAEFANVANFLIAVSEAGNDWNDPLP